MLRVAWLVAVPAAALFGGFFGLVPVLALGLSVPGLIIGPLAFATGALFAGLGAAWTGTLFAPDRSRSRLVPILLASEVAAVLALLAGAALLVSPRVSGGYGGPTLAEALWICVPIVAAGASLATWWFRHASGRRLSNDAAISLVLATLAPLIVAGTVYVGCSVVTCGP